MVHCGHLAHYWHKNIAGPKVSVWKDGYRGFEDEVEMSHHIVKVFNQTMKEEDILYHLGDWSFGGIQNIWNFRKQLRIKTIHLILGNHDQHIKGNKILPEIIIPARSIFTSVQNALDIVIDKREIFMNHYPYVTWPHKDKEAIMLHGHCVDEETELLTAEGWKKYKSIKIDDMIYSYNSDTKYLEIGKIKDIYI